MMEVVEWQEEYRPALYYLLEWLRLEPGTGWLLLLCVVASMAVLMLCYVSISLTLSYFRLRRKLQALDDKLEAKLQELAREEGLL